jgi:hypothetical protein
MNLDSYDLVASLQALPETDPIEVDGIQFGGKRCGGGGGNNTCQSRCTLLTLNIIQTVCVAVLGAATC